MARQLNGRPSVLTVLASVGACAVIAAIAHPTSRSYVKRQLGLEEDPDVIAARARDKSRRKLGHLEELSSALNSNLDKLQEDLDIALEKYKQEQTDYQRAKEERDRLRAQEEARKAEKEQESNGGVPTDESQAGTGLKGSAYYHFDSKGRKLANKWDELDVEAELRKLDDEETLKPPLEPKWPQRRRALFKPLTNRTAKLKQQLTIALGHLDKMDLGPRTPQKTEESVSESKQRTWEEEQDEEVRKRIIAITAELRMERKRLAHSLDREVGVRVDECEKRLREVDGWILT
eukprot:gb/GEZN01012216.1/.p1 GENE.gb/GEZN01012216.1/~~gb/GEZN01012216.1/.p1  ORF type:complete len:290 (-),score=61.30 gb/GEZN01012216.1/:204-1073(-)